MPFLNFASFKGRRDFFCIFAVDFILRWFYQLGKTPLLPLYAAAIGAGEIMIGFIVGISTSSGIEPFKKLSDIENNWRVVNVPREEGKVPVILLF